MAERVIIYGPNGAPLVNAESTTHVSGDNGVMPLAVRQDADGGYSALANAGEYIPFITASDGSLRVQLTYSAGNIVTGGAANAEPAGNVKVLNFNSMPHTLAGTDSNTWVPVRGSNRTAYLASAARTGDVNGASRANNGYRGLIILFNVSAIGAPAGSVTVRVQIQDETSANWISIASAAAAVATTGQRAYILYPTAENNEGYTEHWNQIVGGRLYRVQMDHANETDSITYSVELIELL